MTEKVDKAPMIETLESFVTLFEDYAFVVLRSDHVTFGEMAQHLGICEALRSRLRRMEPKVTSILIRVIGNSVHYLGHGMDATTQNLVTIPKP